MSNEYKRFNVKEFTTFDDIGEIFAHFFKNIKRNKNVVKVCKITKQQAKEGITKNIKIPVADTCENCNDIGYIYNEKNMVVTIPPKTKNNDYIVFEGNGNQFKANEKRGDIFIKIQIYGDRSKRKGNRAYKIYGNKQ